MSDNAFDTLKTKPGMAVRRCGVLKHDGTMTCGDDEEGRESICMVAAGGIIAAMSVHADGLIFFSVYRDTGDALNGNEIAEAAYDPEIGKLSVTRAYNRKSKVGHE